MDALAPHPTVQLLTRPEGRISFTSEGDGPLVVLVPGMGDLRSTWRDLIDPIAGAGYRVVATDLRGHGDSDVTFTEHGVVATGTDLLALVEHLGGPAVLVGSSVGAGASVWAASERPDLVAGLVLLAPHIQDHGPASTIVRLQVSLLLRRPWGPAAWKAFYTSLNRGRRAPWLGEHTREISAALREPGRTEQFAALARALVAEFVDVHPARVEAPALVLLGERDPEFTDPAAELAWILEHLPASDGQLIPDSGHYPQSQRPDIVVPLVVEHLSGLARTGPTWAAPRGDRA